MLETVLTARNCSVKTKITVKSCVAAGVVALAVILPQIVHAALGQPGGVQWLPMYLPVLLGGCLLGYRWGAALGVASPLISFLITSLWHQPMPAAARLPFMMVELAVFATVAGLFEKKIAENGWMAFPAVLLGAVSGRTVFMLTVLIFQKVSTLKPQMIWEQIQKGLLALVLQAVIVPFIVMGVGKLLAMEKKQSGDDTPSDHV